MTIEQKIKEIEKIRIQGHCKRQLRCENDKAKREGHRLGQGCENQDY